MTKKEIIKLIADKFDRPQVLVKDIVQETLNLIVESLVKEGRIELRNFGVFEVRLRKERRARNPRTGEDLTVAEKKVVGFMPGKVMVERTKHAEKVVEARVKPPKGSRNGQAAPPTDPEPNPEGELVPVGARAEEYEADGLPMKPR